MRLRRAAPTLLLLSLLFAGCFQVHTVIFLNEDGSGTIEETIQLANFAVEMMASVDTTQAFSLIDEEKLVARADSLGEGVVFEGVEAISDDSFTGYLATYSFSDINMVRLHDSDALQLADESATDDSSEGLDGLGLSGVTFSFEPGELRINIPHEEGPGEEMHPDTLAAKTEEMRQQMQESGGLMRAFLADARLAVTIEFPSLISETNAAYSADSSITLADITFGPLLDLMAENPELAVRLQEAQTEPQRQAILSEMGGEEEFHYEPSSEVVVRFD